MVRRTIGPERVAHAMAKRAFHNLDGVLRDMLAAVDTDGEGYERLLAFVRIIADILDILEDDDSELPDPADGSGGEPDAGLGLRDGADGQELGRLAPRHDSVRPAPVAGTSRMAAQVGYLRATELAEASLPRSSGAMERAGKRHRSVRGGS